MQTLAENLQIGWLVPEISSSRFCKTIEKKFSIIFILYWLGYLKINIELKLILLDHIHVYTGV